MDFKEGDSGSLKSLYSGVKEGDSELLKSQYSGVKEGDIEFLKSLYSGVKEGDSESLKSLYSGVAEDKIRLFIVHACRRLELEVSSAHTGTNKLACTRLALWQFICGIGSKVNLVSLVLKLNVLPF